jgi:hypothetical protein
MAAIPGAIPTPEKQAPATCSAGVGYFGVDGALTKGWKVRESQLLKFA